MVQILISLALLLITPSTDQSVFIRDVAAFTDIVWTPDSKHLIVTDIHEKIYRYNVADGTIVEIDQSPFVGTLTDTEMDRFPALEPTIYQSPYSGLFIFHSQTRGRDAWTPILMLGWGGDGDAFISYYPLRVNSDYAIVHWSQAGANFLIQSTPPYGGGDNLYHVSEHQTPRGAWTISELLVTSLDRVHDPLFDLSEDGRRILILDSIDHTIVHLIEIHIPSPQMPYLFVDQEREIEMNSNVIGGAFTDDDNVLLLVTADGIVTYDLRSRDTAIVNAAATSSESRWVIFSPDNRYAAVVTDQPDDPYKKSISVIPVQAGE